MFVVNPHVWMLKNDMLMRISLPERPVNYRADIDGLRALAIISVVVFHTYPEFLPGGYVGVDIFFVISGYLISYILFKELDSGGINLFKFYSKRIRRIFPALVFLLLCMSIIGSILLSPQEFKDLGKQIIYGSAFIENIYLIGHTGGYFDTATELMPLMHLWTLAVEEQYYIIYPIICLLIWKLGKRIFFILGVLWGISFTLNCYHDLTSPIISFFSLHTRFWELCTGCLLAGIVRYCPNLIGSLNRKFYYQNISLGDVLSLIGFVLISISVFLFKESILYRGASTLLPVAGAALVILSKNSILNSRLLSNNIATSIGVISYTWYLWHWPLLAIARNLNGGELPDLLSCTILMVVGFLFSLISYYLIENPIRKLNISFQRTCLLTGGVFLCCLMGFTIRETDGFPSRPGIDTQAVVRIKNSFPQKNDSAIKRFKCPEELSYCWIKEDYDPTVALIGDSHAHHLAHGLNNILDKNFLLIGQAGTPPVRGLLCLKHEKKKDTSFMMEKAIDIVSNNPSIQTVILSARWDLFTYFKHIPYLWRGLNPEEDRYVVLELFLTKLLEEFTLKGKRIILLLDIPQNPLDPKKCLSSRPFMPSSINCSFSIQHHYKIDGKTNDVIKQVVSKFPSVILLDSSEAICPNNLCFTAKNDKVLYHDESHLTEDGSIMVVRDLLEKLKKINFQF